MITDQGALESFREFCDGIVKDVISTYPIQPDVGYDAYVERGVYKEAPGQIFAVMDMGEVGQWVFQATEEDRYTAIADNRIVDWVDVSGSFNPVQVKQDIVAKRAGS